ncbi:cation:proton antiporter [Aquisalimonas lutea]|uniref:cation:proton antiporter family protein n=1 Tax=Aquisalimonas lutea TaxID=1327750 RepID=UPI0025B521B3|nr:cation:proton antiporter family protein [Aquisalimonas lutea]MDN3516408.1 cation:proton antiporter [Aquisalimonas lutea]
MIEVVSLCFAFVFGMLIKQIGLPPLVGFLAAGFAIHAFGPALGVPMADARPVLDHIAHLGVLLLLFTVGLKLKLRNLVEPAVIGGALVHFAVTVAIFAIGISFLLDVDQRTALLLASALAFSSTVLAAKVLEAKRELRALHGRIAIGILIIQDLIALAVLSVAGGHSPSPWALLLFALPLLRPVLYRLLDIAGHEELLVLMGVVLAVVAGGAGFELVGVSPELGALLMGVLLAGHPRAHELSASLWGLKEVLLIGFFLQIGMQGLPDAQAISFAVIFALVLPLKGALFFFLLTRFRLRARNAFLGGLTLTCYSEFGLIVAAGVLQEWVVPLALTVALSFVIAAPVNRIAHALYGRVQGQLQPFERRTHHPDEQPTSFGDADVLVMGMGRTGTAALDFLSERGLRTVGVDADPSKVADHVRQGRNVLYADVEDVGFWDRVILGNVRAAILAMPEIEGKLIATRHLRRLGFTGPIVANALFADDAEQVRAAGADEVYLTMTGAGHGLADKVRQAL